MAPPETPDMEVFKIKGVKAMRLTKRTVIAVLLLALTGSLAACAISPSDVSQREESHTSIGIQSQQESWPNIEDILARIPPEELQKPATGDAFILVGTQGQEIRVPRPPMTKGTAWRLWWEAQRRAHDRIVQRWREMIQSNDDTLSYPAFKAQFEPENLKILAEELRRVIDEWKRSQSSSSR